RMSLGGAPPSSSKSASTSAKPSGCSSAATRQTGSAARAAATHARTRTALPNGASRRTQASRPCCSSDTLRHQLALEPHPDQELWPEEARVLDGVELDAGRLAHASTTWAL